MQDLVDGQIDLRFAAEGSQSLPHLLDGQLKALAVPHPPARPHARRANIGQGSNGDILASYANGIRSEQP